MTIVQPGVVNEGVCMAATEVRKCQPRRLVDGAQTSNLSDSAAGRTGTEQMALAALQIRTQPPVRRCNTVTPKLCTPLHRHAR